jgi:hypothetical protein
MTFRRRKLTIDACNMPVLTTCRSEADVSEQENQQPHPQQQAGMWGRFTNVSTIVAYRLSIINIYLAVVVLLFDKKSTGDNNTFAAGD